MMLRHAVFLMCTCCALGLPVKAGDVTIFAAASLKTALDEIVQDHPATVSYAATSTLARQIELGAPADLVITASTDWMGHLDAAGRVAKGTRTDLLGNTLVLIAPADMAFIMQADRPVDEVIGNARIAMALVDAVPAGIYGKQALTALDHWDTLAPQIVQTDNVRAALRLVAMGEAPFGVVYATDAAAEPRVQIVHRFDPADHAPIRYQLAIVAGQDSLDTRAMLEHLQSESAAEVFAGQGFRVQADLR